MIVPSTRSLRLGVLILLPFSVVAVTASESSALSLGLLCVFIGVWVLDAALTIGRSKLFEVSVPDVVRLTRRQKGTIPLELISEELSRNSMRVGFALPEDMDIVSETVRIEASEQTTRTALFECTPMERGETPLTEVYVALPSPLGLWSQQIKKPIRTLLRVYPDVSRERKHAAALFLKHRRLGPRAMRMVGKGREFEKLRDYQPGDSYEDIHWKATARRNSPVTKLYQIEQTQKVLLCLDHGRLSGRLLPDDREILEETILEKMLQAGLLLGGAAQGQGDYLGVLSFAERITKFVPPGQGVAHYQACREALFDIESRSTATDFYELSRFIQTRQRKRSLIVLLTCLDDPVGSEQCAKALQPLAKRHVVLVVNMKPDVARPVFSGVEPMSEEHVYREISGHHMWQTLRQVERDLQQHGVQVRQTGRSEMTPTLINAYMEIKQRQLV